jgi:predicted transcriptional regulator
MGVNMKTIVVKQLDEKDEEIADALISLGMSRNAALTLVYMQNANSATSLELERSYSMIQLLPQLCWTGFCIIVPL